MVNTIDKYMKKFSYFLMLTLFFSAKANAQSPAIYSSADILQQIKKLEVFGSVLYIAAHPDDENTRLLGYLANERKFRTGYLSLTRGDGGQNLIGDEQGIDLGLIRTQELLSARRVDGAEQFFSRAFDFGFSKNPEEALRIWGHDKILADVVWAIRKFKPDVIITRFPTTGEGGHGHHTASAILAGEAYDAAADATKFPEQLKYVTIWQAKRLLWNTFNFGGNSTQREDQFKIDCGVYNPILGKSYGEIAAESRSRHKSQGFGVPAQRGKNIEYFATIKGDKPINDLMDGVDSSVYKTAEAKEYFSLVNDVIKNYDFSAPKSSISKLQSLERGAAQFTFVHISKKILMQNIIASCAGVFMEATAINQLNVIGDSMKLKFSFINRTNVNIDNATVKFFEQSFVLDSLRTNENREIIASVKIDNKAVVTQPYFLEKPMNIGTYNADLEDIGKPQNDPLFTKFSMRINGNNYIFNIPIMYKYTDPVKGELYEPIQIVSPAFVNVMPNLLIFSSHKKNEKKPINFTIQSNLPLNEKVKFYTLQNKESKLIADTSLNMSKTSKAVISTILNGNDFANDATTSVGGELAAPSMFEHQYTSLKKISYDHIPDIFYNYQDRIKVLKIDLKTVGSKAGYIAGAGDKVPQALEQMGYKVTMLTEKDITAVNLKQFDVIITGVRAYNIHAWLSNVYPILMQYVKDGGVLLTQYNTNNQLGPVKANMAPYPFTISRNRITDETATVNFLLPNHPALNYPNKITEKDFDGWIQERSIYNAEKIDSSYKKIFSMKDPEETEQDGSLIVADYGKGKYVYTGLVFFRELPAGVGGAYRLFANLIAKRKS
jgi:LmbE family N-acetylglucosaminyl deacetylase